jgi:type VI secretion system protein VasD
MAAIAIWAVVCAGCSSPAVEVNLSSTANLNMNEDKEPLPVVVRVYQLSQRQPFEAASFKELWKNDMVTLGNSLLIKEEEVIDPAYSEKLEMPRHDQAKYVGVVAIFRDPEPERWKGITSLSTSWIGRQFSSDISIALKGNSVEIE